MVPLNWLVIGYDLGVGAIDQFFSGQANTSQIENQRLLEVAEKAHNFVIHVHVRRLI